MRIRGARASDRDALAAFAVDTFDWGDYVLDSLDGWLDDATGALYVAVDGDDRAVAVARGVLLSPHEAWFQGARVHPDHRRHGLASALGDVLIDWARQRGAQVARLAVEEWNTAARAQVEASGMRRVALFARAVRELGAGEPRPDGNGGRRARADNQLVPAPAAEAESAFVSWSSSELSRAVRGLFAVHWTWRRLTVEDLRAAAAGGALWTARSGWVMAAVAEETVEVAWCDTAAESAEDMARSLVDLAEDRSSASVAAMIPAAPWLEEAFATCGYELNRIRVYAIGL